MSPFTSVVSTTSPYTSRIVQDYLKTKRFAEDRDGNKAWLVRKEMVEYGFSPEVEALTDALVQTARETMHDLSDQGHRLLQETCWRIAVKFYARDAWENACREVYNHLVFHSADLLNRLEVPLLDQLGWQLPFDRARELLPQVIERQVARLDDALREASREAAEKRSAFHRNEATEEEAVQAIMYEQWIIFMREYRRQELRAEGGDELAFRTLSASARRAVFPQFEETAKRMLKKRPVRACLVSSQV